MEKMKNGIRYTLKKIFAKYFRLRSTLSWKLMYPNNIRFENSNWAVLWISQYFTDGNLRFNTIKTFENKFFFPPCVFCWNMRRRLFVKEKKTFVYILRYRMVTEFQIGKWIRKKSIVKLLGVSGVCHSYEKCFPFFLSISAFMRLFFIAKLVLKENSKSIITV